MMRCSARSSRRESKFPKIFQTPGLFFYLNTKQLFGGRKENHLKVDVDRIEAAEKSIDAFINSQSKAKTRANEEADLWKASERRVQEIRRRENREAWLEYYEMMNQLHLGI